MTAADSHAKKFQLRREARLPADLLDSPAWAALNATEMRVLIRFFQKRSWVNRKGRKLQYIEEPLVFTYAEGRAVLNISDTTFFRALRQLVTVGFVDIDHAGGAFARDVSRYRMSNRWKAWRTPEFISVEKPRRLKPGQDVQSRKTAARGARIKPGLEVVK